MANHTLLNQVIASGHLPFLTRADFRAKLESSLNVRDSAKEPGRIFLIITNYEINTKYESTKRGVFEGFVFR